MSPRRSILLFVVVIVALLAFVVFQIFQDEAPKTEQHFDSALQQLAEIQTRAPVSSSGYSRHEFGERWADVDRNGCDTRNDVLGRDLIQAVPADQYGCRIGSGVLIDPYSGERIIFRRGEATSAKVQIDHVVSMSDAWRKGAQDLSFKEREEFANDPLNLLAVDGEMNKAKSNFDASEWLPPRKDFHCEFVSIHVAVKYKYELWMTPQEHQSIQKLLEEQCPQQPVYVGP